MLNKKFSRQAVKLCASTNAKLGGRYGSHNAGTEQY